MREVELAAVSRGVSLDALMENAGLTVADAVAKWAFIRSGGKDSELAVAGKPIAVLVGPGNNGGDGLVAARHLAARGARATCFVLLPRKSPDPKLGLAVKAGAKVMDVRECGGLPGLASALQEPEVILDAVFGTGQNRPISEPLTGALRAARHSGRPVVAIDLPTGTDSDTGRFDPNGLPADVTLMLGLPKLGPLIRPVEARCGRIDVLDIGLPAGVDEHIKTEWLTRELAGALLPRRPVDGHKGTFGRVLILGGSRNYIGAPLLAARGALRSGAGLVELALPESAYFLAAGQVQEAIYRPLPEQAGGRLHPVRAGQEALSAMSEATAALIGPGLGQGRATAEVVLALLSNMPEGLPVVLDADALNIGAASYRLWERLPAPAILTPHPGEMARLLGCSTKDVQEDRLAAAKTGAAQWGKTVVLKGAATVTAAPDGAVRVSPWVNSGLAKGGTGDVLAGLVAGLLAQRPASPFDAASLGVYLHGAAGDIARARHGEFAMTAGDVVDCLPAAFDEIAEGRQT
jgi:NAD(P)H-hydrate epimerase